MARMRWISVRVRQDQWEAIRDMMSAHRIKTISYAVRRMIDLAMENMPGLVHDREEDDDAGRD